MTITPLDLRALLAKEVADAENRRREELQSSSNYSHFQRLALLPSWTRALAEFCAIRGNGVTVEDVIADGLQQRILVAEAAMQDGERIERFWIQAPTRRELLASCRDSTPEWIGDLARAVLRAESAGISTTRQSRVLADLLLARESASDPGPFEIIVNQRFEEALARDGVSVGETWLAAMHDLAVATPDWVLPITERLRRRVNLAYRLDQDERRLRFFIEREEQLAVTRRLLTEQGDLWCVHFLGVGGVGKTMLMRYLTVRGWKDYKYHVARVDFDHLSPDYPLRDPGAMLAALATELRMYSRESRLDDLFETLRLALESLARRMRSASAPPVGREILQLREFQRVRQPFVDILNRLGRVLLIFDTCEELAKFHPYDTNLPSLEVTFQILEDLHRDAKSLRVVFSGRRPLARAGGQNLKLDRPWRCHEASASRLPVEKRDLAVHLVRGFSAREAESYFETIPLRWVSHQPGQPPGASVASRLPESIRSRILRQSGEIAPPVQISFEPPDAADAQPRFNPFDLHLFTSWVLDDPDSAMKWIESDEFDIYVQQRIVERLDPETRALVPIAVVLWGFDQAMLSATALVPEANVTNAFRLLSEQEWIAPSRVGETVILEADRNLAPRLNKYFHAGHRVDLPLGNGSVTMDELGRTIAARLVDSARATGLAQISQQVADVVLRRHDRRSAAHFWNEVCLAMAEAEDWPRLAKLTSFLLGDDGAIGSAPKHPLGAAVRAAHVSCLLHTSPQVDHDTHWRGALAALPFESAGSSDSAAPSWLAMRIRLRLDGVRSSDFARETPFWADPAAAAPLLHVQMIGSRVAALEREIDRLARGGKLANTGATNTIHDNLVNLASQLAQARAAFADESSVTLGDDPASCARWVAAIDDLRGFIGTQLARIETTLASSIPSAFDQGSPLPESAAPPHQCWLDLLLPEEPKARGLLELVRRFLDWHSSHEDDYMLLESTWRSLHALSLKFLAAAGKGATGRTLSTDRDALLAALLEVCAARAPLNINQASSLEAVAAAQPPRQAMCLAHRTTPPLQVAAAFALADAGLPQRALRLIDVYLSQFRSSLDTDTSGAFFLARVEIARRFRLHRELSNYQSLLNDPAIPRATVLAAAAIALPIPRGLRETVDAEVKSLVSEDKLERIVASRQHERAQVAVSRAELRGWLEQEGASQEALTAVEWFANIPDSLGAMRASILGCQLAPAERRSTGNLLLVWESWYDRHSGLAQSLQLPSSREIEAMADDLAQPAEGLGANVKAPPKWPLADSWIAHPVLGGWLLRILALKVAEKKRAAGIEQVSRFERSLEFEFPDGLPRELEQALAIRAIAVRRSLWRRVGGFAAGLASFVVGLAIVLGGVALVYYGLQKGWQFLSTTAEITPTHVALVIPVLLWAALAVLFWFWLRTRVRLRLTILDQLSPGHSFSPYSASNDVRVRLQLATEQWRAIRLRDEPMKANVDAEISTSWFLNLLIRSWGPFRIVRRMATTDSVEVTLENPTAPQLSEILRAVPDLVERLDEIRQRARWFGINVELRVSPSLAEWPWETAVRGLLRVEKLAWYRTDGLRIFRTGAPLLAPLAAPVGDRLLLLQAPQFAAELARHGKIGVETLTLEEFLSLSSFAPTESGGTQSVALSSVRARPLIVVGKAVQDTSGVFLTLLESAASPDAVASQTLQPRQLAQQSSPLIVLAEGAVDLDERLETDRRQSALMKVAGADAFESGAERVLVIPAMPHKILLEVLSELARSLDDRPVRNFRLDFAAILARLRSVVLTGQAWRLEQSAARRTEWSQETKASEASLVELADELSLWIRPLPWPDASSRE